MSKLQNEIYQRLHGFKSIERGYKRAGQSDYYYIDPRYDGDEERGQIDVPSENSPNPRLEDIVADDIQQNPEDYYIWRTVGDDRVRSKHAEREGKIFNWHVPPEGGARIKTTAAPVVFTASGEVLLMSKGGVNRL